MPIPERLIPSEAKKMNNTKKNNKLLAFIAGATLLLAAQSGVANATPISFSITSGLWVLGSGWDEACTGAGCDAGHTKVNADWMIAPSVAGKTFTLTDFHVQIWLCQTG